MSGPLPARQPFVPLAVVTLAVVVLALLAGNAGVQIISGVVQILFAVIALIAMAVLARYLWNRGAT